MHAGRGGRASAVKANSQRCVQAAASGPTPRKIEADKQVDIVRPPVSQGHAWSSGLSMSPKLSPRLSQERAQVSTTPRAAPGKAAVYCAADMHVRRTAHADACAKAPRSLQSTRIPSPASEANKVAGQLEVQTRRFEELKAKLALDRERARREELEFEMALATQRERIEAAVALQATVRRYSSVDEPQDPKAAAAAEDLGSGAKAALQKDGAEIQRPNRARLALARRNRQLDFEQASQGRASEIQINGCLVEVAQVNEADEDGSQARAEPPRLAPPNEIEGDGEHEMIVSKQSSSNSEPYCTLDEGTEQEQVPRAHANLEVQEVRDTRVEGDEAPDASLHGKLEAEPVEAANTLGDREAVLGEPAQGKRVELDRMLAVVNVAGTGIQSVQSARPICLTFCRKSSQPDTYAAAAGDETWLRPTIPHSAKPQPRMAPSARVPDQTAKSPEPPTTAAALIEDRTPVTATDEDVHEDVHGLLDSDPVSPQNVHSTNVHEVQEVLRTSGNLLPASVLSAQDTMDSSQRAATRAEPRTAPAANEHVENQQASAQISPLWQRARAKLHALMRFSKGSSFRVDVARSTHSIEFKLLGYWLKRRLAIQLIFCAAYITALFLTSSQWNMRELYNLELAAEHFVVGQTFHTDQASNMTPTEVVHHSLHDVTDSKKLMLWLESLFEELVRKPPISFFLHDNPLRTTPWLVTNDEIVVLHENWTETRQILNGLRERQWFRLDDSHIEAYVVLHSSTLDCLLLLYVRFDDKLSSQAHARAKMDFMSIPSSLYPTNPGLFTLKLLNELVYAGCVLFHLQQCVVQVGARASFRQPVTRASPEPSLRLAHSHSSFLLQERFGHTVQLMHAAIMLVVAVIWLVLIHFHAQLWHPAFMQQPPDAMVAVFWQYFAAERFFFATNAILVLLAILKLLLFSGASPRLSLFLRTISHALPALSSLLFTFGGGLVTFAFMMHLWLGFNRVEGHESLLGSIRACFDLLSDPFHFESLDSHRHIHRAASNDAPFFFFYYTYMTVIVLLGSPLISATVLRAHASASCTGSSEDSERLSLGPLRATAAACGQGFKGFEMAPADEDILVLLHVALRRMEAVAWVSIGSIQKDLMQAYGIQLAEDELLLRLTMRPSRTLPSLPGGNLPTPLRSCFATGGHSKHTSTESAKRAKHSHDHQTRVLNRKRDNLAKLDAGIERTAKRVNALLDQLVGIQRLAEQLSTESSPQAPVASDGISHCKEAPAQIKSAHTLDDT